MEDVVILYGRLVCFTVILVYYKAIWYIFRTLVFFSCFGMLCRDKSGNPARAAHDFFVSLKKKHIPRD
jgi:hypothetical protein